MSTVSARVLMVQRDPSSERQTSLTIPGLDRLYDIPVRRQVGTVWSNIVDWWLDLVEDEDRRPPMMVDGFFVVRLQSYLKHAKPLALKEDFVVLWRCDHGVQCRIPTGGVQIRTIICPGFHFGG